METNYPLRTKPRISYFSRETIIKPSEKPKNKNTFPCILCYRKLKTHQELKNHRVICHRNYLEIDNIIHKYYIRNANFFNIYNLQFNPHNDFQINFLAQPIYVNYEKHFCLHKTIPENRFLYNLYLSTLLQYFPSQKYLDPPHYNNDIFILENCITYGKKQLYKTTDLIKHQILLYIYRLNQLTSNPLPKFLTAKDYPLIKAIIHFCQHYMKNKSKNRPFEIPQELELCFDLDTDVKTQNMQIIRARNFQRPIGIKARDCPVPINMFDKLVLYMIRKMNPKVACLTPSLHYKLGVRDRIAHKKRIKCAEHCNTILNEMNDAFISSTLNTIKTDVFDEIVNMSQRETQQSLSHSSADDPLIDVTYCDCCWRGLTPSKSFPNNLSHKVLCAKSSTFHSPKMVTAKKLIRPKNLVIKTDLDYNTNSLTFTNPSVPKLKPLVSPCLAIKRKYTKRHIQNYQHTQNLEKNNAQQVKKYVLNPTHVTSIQEITNNYTNSIPHVLHKSTNINLVDLTDEDNNYKTPTNHEKMLNGNVNCQETIFSFSSSQKRKLDSNTQDSVFKNLSINGAKAESLMRKKFQRLDNEVSHSKNLRSLPMIILYCHICKHYELVSTQDQIKGKISDHSTLFHKDTQLDIKFSQKNDNKNGTNILLVECNKS